MFSTYLLTEINLSYEADKKVFVIVPCSAGVGRTGTFATVDYCMERMEGEGSVDIFNFVQQMRYKRNYMVQTAVSSTQQEEC